MQQQVMVSLVGIYYPQGYISRNDYVIRVYLNHRIRQMSGELNC